MNNDYVFFLGGYDLEMLEIKKILEENNCKLYDKNLSWGAKASSYKDELSNLEQDEIPVLIELEIDIKVPDKSIIIDHHNEKAGKDVKTSIEQLAELINIELNREQKLISANDRAHIQGMIELGASEEEIKDIRERDRKAQGVTDEDERLSLLSIEHFSYRISKDLIIIYSLTQKTSPIIDNLYKYYRHIFIIDFTGGLYYSGTGQIVELLSEVYKKYKKNDPNIECWKGGNLPFSGYFGSNNISGGSLLMTKKDIIEFMKPYIEEEIIYSQHIFMFPFMIEMRKLNNVESTEDNKLIKSKSILKTINKKLKKSIWKYKPHRVLLDIPADIRAQLMHLKDDNCSPYSDSELWAFNEHSYFYEFIHDTLFTYYKEEEIELNDNIISLYYEVDISPKDEITFIIKGDTQYIYTLRVDNISLRIFESEVGVLSFTLYNTCYKDFEDIQRINDFGRRIYPQFLGTGGVKEPIDSTKYSFFCDKIIFNISNLYIEEEFKTEDFIEIYKKNNNKPEINYAKYIKELLKPLDDEELTYRSVNDDRMYILCWYGNNDMINRLKKFNNIEYAYENDESWYRYIFIDGSKETMIKNNKMRRKLIKKSTYGRFVEGNTLFGISRYSFVCLTDTGYFAYNVIRNHMQKVYYQISVLLLAQRASIICFSNKLEKINIVTNEKLNKEKEFEYVEKKVKDLENLDYRILNFINRMTYKEVTPQEQGIELYTLALKRMNINKQLYVLRQKVNDLHMTADQVLERIHLIQEREMNDRQRQTKAFFDKITLIGLIFAPLTLYQTVSKFINPYIKIPSYLEGTYFSKIWSLLFLSFLSILSYCLINDDYSNKKRFPRDPWFYPLKALSQQFLCLKSKKELFVWKIILNLLLLILIVLSWESILSFFRIITL
ncbi:MAG: hypothetical protein QXJ06_03360 [Candidatus Aenigmatarchaeota archaeon]